MPAACKAERGAEGEGAAAAVPSVRSRRTFLDYGIHSSSSSGRSGHGAVEAQVHLREPRRGDGRAYSGARDAHQGLESFAGRAMALRYAEATDNSNNTAPAAAVQTAVVESHRLLLYK